jgi:hypothetical protein
MSPPTNCSQFSRAQDDGPPEIRARRERLASCAHLIAEGWKYLLGAMQIRPDPRLKACLDAAARMEREVGLEILTLGGNVEGPRSEDRPPPLEEAAGADGRLVVTGTISPDEILEFGPLAISHRDSFLRVDVRGRGAIILGTFPSGIVRFSAQPEGADYPRVVAAPWAVDAADPPLAKWGQGDTETVVRPEDLQ